MPDHLHHPASFRDPSGFVFREDGLYYRQVNKIYAEDYELLMHSGLFRELTEKGYLLAHREVKETSGSLADSQQGPADGQMGAGDGYKVLLPEQLTLVTYPYEWTFDQLRDAALCTLRVMETALEHGMILKDASPFNIQFRNGSPVFIDTLSFEKYDASLPWVAYRQFCECFLFPLYLEHYCGLGLQKVLTAYPDGIPATVTARLLPWKSRLHMGPWLHVYLQRMVGNHIRAQGPEQEQRRAPASFNKEKLRNLIRNLDSILQGLRSKVDADSTWNNYYAGTILSRQYLEDKEKIFRAFIAQVPFSSALDLGSNDGYFSQILAGKADTVVSIDGDATCVNNLYRAGREMKKFNIMPLCVDLMHPSPAIGFRNMERNSFHDRVRAEMVVALALVHHLVLGRNVPLSDVPAFMADLTTAYLIIEFVPAGDPKAQELIRHKNRHHLPYDVPFFEACCGRSFVILDKKAIPGTERILYLMKKIQPAL